MIVPLNNQWRHGPSRFVGPVVPAAIHGVDGITITRSVLDLEIGNEITLVIADSTPFLEALKRTEPLNLRIFGGVDVNEYGCVGFLLFWIPSTHAQEVPLAIYDFYVNLHEEWAIAPLRELANQTHWHLFVVDGKGQQKRFIEFKNTFRLNEILETMLTHAQGFPAGDFDRAKAAFMARRSLIDLYAAGPTKSTVSQEGVSVYDDVHALPGSDGLANPFRKARFVDVYRKSVDFHRDNPTVTRLDHLDHRLHDLLNDLHGRQIIYLDVCHWIKLRHVWLQSPMALPVYQKLLRVLLGLIGKKLVLCPLSGPIFQELMKQEDPRTRAATANLIELFSSGITLVALEESFMRQCFGLLSSRSDNYSNRFWQISKIGLWFNDELASKAWWSSDIADIWDNVSVDVRWNLTVCDCQELVGLGNSPIINQPSCFQKWSSLPAQQKLAPKRFLDLVRECRHDLVTEFKGETVNRLKALLGSSIEPARLEHLDKELADFETKHGFGIFPSFEILAAMCAGQVFRGGKIRSHDTFDFLHASMGIPASAAYFCDGPMDHLLRNKILKLDEAFGVTIKSDPHELLEYLEKVEAEALR